MNLRRETVVVVLGWLVLGIAPVRGEGAVAAPPLLAKPGSVDAVAVALDDLRNGRQGEAERVLAEAAAREPKSAQVLFWRAVCIRSRFELAEAKPAFGTVISRAPDSTEAVAAACMLGIDFSRDWGSALHYYQCLLALGARHPDDEGILWLSALAPRSLLKSRALPDRLRGPLANRGIDAYRALLARFAPGQGPVLVHQTLANLLDDERGDHLLALPHREAAVRLERRPWSLQAYAETLRELGRYEESAKLCREALSLDPDYDTAGYTLGLALWEDGRADEAFVAWGAAGKSERAFYLVYYGRLALQAGQWRRAWDYLSAAAEAMPDDAATKIYLARAGVHVGRPGACEQVIAAGTFDFQANPIAGGDPNPDPWFRAAASGDLATIRKLASPENIDRRAEGSVTSTALMRAAQNGWVEIVQELIDRHAKLDIVDGNGDTALNYAAQFNQSGCVSALLAAGANPELHDTWGQTPLIGAIYSGCDAGVRVLVAHGADVSRDVGHGTPMNCALSMGNGQALRLFLAHGADANAAASSTGLTPLMTACLDRRHGAFLQLLIAAGADVNRKDSRGRTALFYALGPDTNTDSVDALIAAGADPRADSPGVTPITQARALGLEALAVKMEAGRPEPFKMPPMQSLSDADSPLSAAFTLPVRFACGQPYALMQDDPDPHYAREALKTSFGLENAPALLAALDRLKHHQGYDRPENERAGLDVGFRSLAETAFLPKGAAEPPDDSAWVQAHRIYFAELGDLAEYLSPEQSAEIIKDATRTITQNVKNGRDFSVSFLAGAERHEGWDRARYEHICDLLLVAGWPSQPWPKEAVSPGKIAEGASEPRPVPKP